MNKLLYFIIAISLGLNGFLLVKTLNKSGVKIQQEAVQDPYPLLARRIFQDEPNDIIINFEGLRTKLKDFVSSQDYKTGVYFEYLPTGIHVGVNDREGFRRASLIKIPAVMRTYKLIEEGRLKKEDKLVIAEKQLDTRFGELWKRGPGAEIPVSEALKLAIVDSDNTAFNILRDKAAELDGNEAGSNNSLLSIYDYLDIPRETGSKVVEISPRSFSSILKSIYFSAYLSYKSSNEILEIMTIPNRPFNILSTGVPEDVKVAHKFAVNRGVEGNDSVTSDCGVVYVPKRQYVLCVMVEAPPEEAAKEISKVSSIVFDYVSKSNIIE